jgi:hypothetical protein
MRLCRTGANWLASPPRWGSGNVRSHGRAQRLAPVRYPLLERAFASVGQLLEIDLFEDLEGEAFGCGAKDSFIRLFVFRVMVGPVSAPWPWRLCR